VEGLAFTDGDPKRSSRFGAIAEHSRPRVGYRHLRASRPDNTEGTWARVIDTAAESPNDFLSPGEEPLVTSTAYTVCPRSIVVLLEI
jgi:hypothetical protein